MGNSPSATLNTEPLSISPYAIFSTKVLACKWLIQYFWKSIHIDQSSVIPNQLPSEIIYLCLKYYLRTHNDAIIEDQLHLQLRKADRMFKLENDDEYIFDTINIKKASFLSDNHSLNQHQLKITVMKHLRLGYTQSMENGNYPCKIKAYCGRLIIHSLGDIYLGKHCSILNSKGDIFIKCNNLYMSNGSRISTYFKYMGNISDNKALLNNTTKHTLFGNIYMDIANDLVIENGCDIVSGDINILCGGVAKIGEEYGNVNIIAKRNNLSLTVGSSLRLHEKSFLAAYKKKVLWKKVDDDTKIPLSSEDIHYSQRNPSLTIRSTPPSMIRSKSADGKYSPTGTVNNFIHSYPSPITKGIGNESIDTEDTDHSDQENEGQLQSMDKEEMEMKQIMDVTDKDNVHFYPTPQIEGDIVIKT